MKNKGIYPLKYIEYSKIGTVEPIYKKHENPNDEYHKLAFIRGFITKYKDKNLKNTEIFRYLSDILKLNENK